VNAPRREGVTAQAVISRALTGERPYDQAARVLDALRRAGYVVHHGDEACQLLTMPEPLPVLPGARRSDPSTSHAAAQASLPGRRSQAWRLLLHYARNTSPQAWGGLTAAEAVAAAGLPVGCWRRVSDLITHGLLEPLVDDDGEEYVRGFRGGLPSRVLRISAAGTDYARQGVASGWPQ